MGLESLQLDKFAQEAKDETLFRDSEWEELTPGKGEILGFSVTCPMNACVYVHRHISQTTCIELGEGGVEAHSLPAHIHSPHLQV